MSVPDYQSLMLPLLKLSTDGQAHSMSESIDKLASQFRLSEQERQELLPSGKQAMFDNRVGWARTYLKKAGILSSPQRGYFQITERGRDVLRDNPTSINVLFLRKYHEFLEFQTTARVKEPTTGLDNKEN